MRKIIHIGYPKNFSTSLQRTFFSVHPDFYHLGIGIETNIGYVDPTIDVLFEVYLRTCKKHFLLMHKDRLKKHLEGHFDKAQELGKDFISASSELLSISQLPSLLDFQEKLSRLKFFFGEDIEFIMIVRNQFDFLRSMYREFIREGYIYSFDKFIYGIFRHQDCSLYYDLSYDLNYSAIREYFPKSSINLFFFENYRNDDKTVADENIGTKRLMVDFAERAGIPHKIKDIDHYHTALSENVSVIKVQLNADTRHNLGNPMTLVANKHRLKNFMEQELNYYEENDVTFEDILIKRKLIEEAKRLAEEKKFQEGINYHADLEITSRMKKYYEEANKKLEKITNLQLPPSYFDLEFTR